MRQLLLPWLPHQKQKLIEATHCSLHRLGAIDSLQRLGYSLQEVLVFCLLPMSPSSIILTLCRERIDYFFLFLEEESAGDAPAPCKGAKSKGVPVSTFLALM